jgi:chaperone required for assembly of F1-ATPase
MRDIFEDVFAVPPSDPTDAARRAMRTPVRARFYREAQVGDGGGEAGAGAGEGGFPVLLDGRPVRTPARQLLAAPVRALAERIAGEWAAQRETIDPAAMPLTRLANAIIDGVMPVPQPVAGEIEKYLGSDLLFYRAPGPEGLLALQRRHWDPVIEWARETLGARFVLAEGVMHVRQPDEAIAAAARAMPRGAGAGELWRLGALNVVTTLTGSALLALALDGRALTAEAAWTAAHVDEDWNMAAWGRDELALQRRAFRHAEFEAAATVLELLREE